MISVVIITYKDEKYIEEQIRSILPQLSFEDEIIVCDDKIGSRTRRIVERISIEDSRVMWVEGKGKGKTASFVFALRHCKGDRIFIGEKGNVWLPDKVKRVNEAFDKGVSLVVHNAYITDDTLNIKEYSLFSEKNISKSFFKSFFKDNFVGSCMAFERKMLKKIMPIPKNLPDFAQWVGLVCSVYGRVHFIDLPLMYCREDKEEKLESGQNTKKRFSRKSYILSKLYKRIFIGV